MNLYPIKHDLPGKLWCGPSALSTSTGLPTSVIHQAIKQARNVTCRHRPVKGVSTRNLEAAAKLLGYELVLVFDFLDEYREASR